MGCASRRLAVPVAMLLLAGGNLGAGPAADSAAAVAAAAGHPSRLHLRAESEDVHNGERETETLETGTGRRLERTCADDLCRGTWFDGSRRYTFGINGTAFPERADDDRAERTFTAIASTAFGERDFIAGGGRVADVDCGRPDESCYRVAAAGGADLVAVADSSTSRLLAVDWPDRTLYRRLAATAAAPAQRASAGAQAPPPLVMYGSRRYDRLERLDAALVAPTALAATVRPVAGDLPLRSATLPIVACSLEGIEARCLLDSGTTPSAVTLGFAERLGREPHGQIEIEGLGRYLTGVIAAGPLTAGSLAIEHLLLAVIPHTPDADFDVVLGSDVLADARELFDRRGNRLRFAAAEADPPGTGAEMELDVASGLPYIAVRMGTRTQSEAMLLDTGDSGTLTIGYDEYREDMSLFAVRGADSAAGLGSSPMDALSGQIAQAEIGGDVLDSVPISAVRGQHAGHVGYAYLARCAEFILDLGRERAACRADAPDFPSRRRERKN